MIEQRYFRRVLTELSIVSLLFAALSIGGIQYQFSVWEFFFDSKIIVMSVLFLLAWQKRRITFSPEFSVVFRFDWRTNAALFFLPILIYGVPILGGLAAAIVSINPVDNAVTLVLATIFDIPAIFTFSVTTVLLEEMIFRGILFQSFKKYFSTFTALLISNGFWTLYCLSDIFGITDLSVEKGIVVGLFFFSVGILCSSLVLKYVSLWPGYSIRIGVISLTPILLTSTLAESDSFFTTESLLFTAEGVLVSIVMMMIGFMIGKKTDQPREIAEK